MFCKFNILKLYNKFMLIFRNKKRVNVNEISLIHNKHRTNVKLTNLAHMIIVQQ